eukprot:CAMPEP_0117050180 /NCGR_PEP_ID=MMETSP0472-20121206/34647_1 /TAXON_ID=693140 ORGANISM="Tiarina fusus, Strain LIS" /NCGR_SAMPLE_ID=MMETSP0472 /ASSEMBLY_ACC=CAM_ASM_000603 /LENGTH=409 /DNA_ID=CAMNT_0004763865 /DNA_START=398 /DNA_END=1626 /DNA_ORIENTATION=-
MIMSAKNIGKHGSVLVERFPDVEINFAKIGITNPISDDPITEFRSQESKCYANEILSAFKALRVKQTPVLDKPKNPNRKDFYKIYVGDPHRGKTLEDNDLTLLLRWENGAKNRDAICQTKLANYYFTICPDMARWWYKKGTIYESPEAAFGRGFCYEFGYAIEEQNFPKAVSLYKRAAVAGFTPALNSLGSILRHTNPSLAFDFFAQAAIRGDLNALCNIALCYLTGKGVEENHGNAITFFSEAAKWNHAASLYHLGNCAALGIGLNPQMSLAVRYWSLAANAGCFESAYNVGKCFYEGICLPKNYVEAFKWFEASAANNQPFAAFWEGFCHRKGHGTEVNEAKALDCFTKSARLGQFLQPDLQVLLHGSLQDQNFDVGFLDEEAAVAADLAAKAAHRLAKFPPNDPHI